MNESSAPTTAVRDIQLAVEALRRVQLGAAHQQVPLAPAVRDAVLERAQPQALHMFLEQIQHDVARGPAGDLSVSTDGKHPTTTCRRLRAVRDRLTENPLTRYF
jgi:hypothetical protein